MDFSKLPPEILASLTPEKIAEMQKQADRQNELIAKHIDAFGELIEKTITEIGDGNAGPVITEILAIFLGLVLGRAPAMIHPQVLMNAVGIIVANLNKARPANAQIAMTTVDPTQVGNGQLVGAKLDFGDEAEDDIQVKLH